VTGSSHAKVGFALYDDGNLQFLEMWQSYTGNLLLAEIESVMEPSEGCPSLLDAFHHSSDNNNNEQTNVTIEEVQST
jgi:hypothetical protein